MNAIIFYDASGRCASGTPALQELKLLNSFFSFLLLYPTCTSTFCAKSIDADPSAEDGTIFFFFFFFFFFFLSSLLS
jgi:hypothetical protein